MSFATCFSLIKIIMMIMSLLLGQLHKMTMKVHLCNRMYEFDIQEEKVTSEKKIALKGKNEDIKNMNSPKILKLSFIQVLNAEIKNIFCKKRITYKEKLYFETENVIQRDTSIIYIIKKLHEIEKIKLILFNEKQLFLFNILSKPLICLPGYQKGKPSQKLFDYLKRGELINTNTKLFEAELKENIKKLSSKNKIDKKLLMLLDQNLTNLKDNDLNNSQRNLIPVWRRFTVS